jgi:wobble nucleotide-excising tRNase
MINSISMKDVASFSPTQATIINTDKKVNLFYGLNGTGKSTISRYLQKKSEIEFSQYSCNFDTNSSSDYEILVYNEDFVEENFYGKENQPGIFTLGQENADAEKFIDIAGEAIIKNDSERTKVLAEKQALDNKLADAKNSIQDRVFAIKRNHEKQALDFCLERAKQKALFFEKLKGVIYENVSYSFKDLEDEAKELQNQAGGQKTVLGRVQLDVSSIESDPIWLEVIVGTGDSYLSTLITKLSNTDWVREGKGYIVESDGQCPFCQQKLPEHFEAELTKLFDKSYEKKLSEIKQLKKAYQSSYDGVIEFFNKLVFDDEYVTRNKDFKAAKEKLISLLEKNIAAIGKKEKNPSVSISLTSTTEQQTELQRIIDSIDSEIKAFNLKIVNKKKSLEEIKLKFWKIVRKTYNADIEVFEKQEKDISKSITVKSTKLNEYNVDDKKQQTVISENRKLITNIDEAIKSINRQIGLLGLEGFWVAKESENSNSYCIKRDRDEDSIVYKTLSEGEKTLVTFLYFLEMCGGSSQQDAPMNLSKRIIVIDDPVSSLSHNYVYEIAHFIYSRFFEMVNNKKELRVRQIFVLTHSLYFFHELIKSKIYRKSIGKLHRITKNTHSASVEMSDDEVQNDYQSYWKIFKDSVTGIGHKVILPNVMRNILEYYFAFIHKRDKLSEALNSLASTHNDFKPLDRYINRGSHNDAINIHDFKDIDVERFKEMFRLIFDETGFIEHYNTMMGSENE